MFIRAKYIILPVIIVLGLLGYRTYYYFFDETVPVICVSGIEENGYYAGDIQCGIEVSDGYKVKDVSVFLDGKPLINHFPINKQHDEHVFPIATKALAQGKHHIKICAQDSSFKCNTAESELTFFVDNQPLQAAFVKPNADFKVFQGRVLHMQFQVNKEIAKAVIKTLSKEYPCIPESNHSLIYECFVPVSTEETPNEYLFTIEITDRVGNTLTLENKFHVVMYPFKQQRLALKKEKLDEENEKWPAAAIFEEKIAELTQKSPAQKLWSGAFYVPIDSRGISTDFGTMRTTPDRGKYAHNALDLLGAPKSVVWASQDGIIVLKDRFAHSGNTVVIDHGCGILSMYFHLDTMPPFNVGDPIKKGRPVGTLGMTGYASGYHLHWELRVNNIAVDPLQWTQHNF